MKSGRVGTSNERRSALPAQFKNGLLMALSCAPARFASSSVFASRILRMATSACSRAGFCPSQSYAGGDERMVNNDVGTDKGEAALGLIPSRDRLVAPQGQTRA